MIRKVFTIFDAATKTYSPPMLYRTIEEAIRVFRREVNEPTSQLSRYPADYSLFELGTFDDETSIFQCHMTPMRVASAHELVQVQPTSVDQGDGRP